MIIGGDVVQVAIAQLCGGPVKIFTPVVFSFGWVTYAVQAMLSAVGDNRLMPSPEVDCCVINAQSGYLRSNKSWVLSRILRDFEHWRGDEPIKIENAKLEELRAEAKKEAEEDGKSFNPEDVRIGLRITIWQCKEASGKPPGDWIYYIGFGVAILQLGIAAIPWGLYGEWLIFLIVLAGTLLSFLSGAIPQWQKEKFGVRTSDKKDVFLTRGNGDHDVLLILGCDNGMDLEALASPYRELKGITYTRRLSLLIATFWILLLLTIAGYGQHTWFMMAAGLIGLLTNVGVAGRHREPKALGIDLEYVDTIVDRKVMSVLWLLEKERPKAGASLIAEFFPGKMFPREEKLWEYADARVKQFKEATKARDETLKKNPHAQVPVPTLWRMPPLKSADKKLNKSNSDIPDANAGEYSGSEQLPDRYVKVNGQPVIV